MGHLGRIFSLFLTQVKVCPLGQFSVSKNKKQTTTMKIPKSLWETFPCFFSEVVGISRIVSIKLLKQMVRYGHPLRFC